MNIHQVMPGFLYGDALGNQAFKMRELLRGWGYESQVYAQFRDSRLADPGEDYQNLQLGDDDLVIFHYSIASPLTQFVHDLPSEKVVVYYHNVTPPRFVRGYNNELSDLLAKGREELSLLKDAKFALAASEYNRTEMLEVGFQNIEVLPYFIYMDELRASAQSEAGRSITQHLNDGVCNWLFVGRLVPNKRQDDIIKAFRYYHELVNPRSRLFLIGSDANTPDYRIELEMVVDAYGLSDAVHLTGPIGFKEGLGGYFAAADVFMCMSEHEGFCVPLMEAMAFDKPVVAFSAAGVPYTMGDAGVLINRKRFDAIGEVAELLYRDGDFRNAVIKRQQQRLLDFSPDRVQDQLQAYISRTLAIAG